MQQRVPREPARCGCRTGAAPSCGAGRCRDEARAIRVGSTPGAPGAPGAANAPGASRAIRAAPAARAPSHGCRAGATPAPDGGSRRATGHAAGGTAPAGGAAREAVVAATGGAPTLTGPATRQRVTPPPPPPAPQPPVAPAAGATPAQRMTGPLRPVNPFMVQDPKQKARRLARALVSDLVVYHPEKRQQGLRDGTLPQLFKDEIEKSWQEYVEQVGQEVAKSTPFWAEALNEILGGGNKVF